MKTILIIEDDPQVSKIYEEALVGSGFKVISAQTGQQGLIALKAAVPDLVLLDIMLSQGMNGFDILEKIKADPDFQKIPVIILTNLDSQRQSAIEIGAADYLVKTDTTLEQIIAKVKALTDKDETLSAIPESERPPASSILSTPR